MSSDEPRGWEASAGAWIARVDHDVSRKFLDPVVLEVAGDVGGKCVLDIGCGEGRFCRLLAARGARTIGVDPTAGLISDAKRRDPHGRYARASADRLPFADQEFDLALFYLVLVDVPDYRAAIAEAARAIKPGGAVLDVNLIPFRTALDGTWVKDEYGHLQCVAVDRYFEERTHHAAWSGISIANYHRTAESYFSAFLDAGLELAGYREPRPTPEQLAESPSLASECRVPLFAIQVWRKP